MPIILGFLAGVGLPIQTSVNTRLRKGRLPLQRSPGVVSCRAIVSIHVVAGHWTGAAYPFRTIVE